MRRSTFAGLLASAALVWAGGSASALTLGFDCVSGNIAGDCAIGEAQLQVEDLAGPGLDEVSFTFSNLGPEPSSITAVYFDDDASTLLMIASIVDGTGVDFEVGATPPDLPSGNEASPPFSVTMGLSADSTAPVEPNGVNPGEEVTIIVTLRPGVSFADVESALGDGSLRVGIFVQGFESGGSESFVNNGAPPVVPEPSLGLLLAGPLLALVWRSRRR